MDHSFHKKQQKFCLNYIFYKIFHNVTNKYISVKNVGDFFKIQKSIKETTKNIFTCFDIVFVWINVIRKLGEVLSYEVVFGLPV